MEVVIDVSKGLAGLWEARAATGTDVDGRGATGEGPLWQRISGLTPAAERTMDPGARRAAIGTLMEVVAGVLRTENSKVKNQKSKVVGGSSGVEGADGAGGASCSLREPGPVGRATQGMEAAGMPVLHTRADVVGEACFYLGISQTRLSELAVQYCGLRVRELMDVLRVKEAVAWIRERAAEAARGWFEEASWELGGELWRARGWDFRAAAAKALSWARTAWAEFKDRLGVALQFGIPSKARLYRAVAASEGLSVEAIEREAAEEEIVRLQKDAPMPPPPPPTPPMSETQKILAQKLPPEEITRQLRAYYVDKYGADYQKAGTEANARYEADYQAGIEADRKWYAEQRRRATE